MRTETIYAVANITPAPVASDAQAMRPANQLFIPFYEGEVYEFEIVLFRDWETKTPAVLPDGIEWWTFAMDVDFDDATPLPVNMSNREPAHASEITVIRTEEETRIRIHCWQFGIYMSRFIGEYGYREGVYAELVGYDPVALENSHCSSFIVAIDNIMIGRPFDRIPIFAIANSFPAWLRDPMNMTRVDRLFFPVKKGHGLVFEIVLFKEEFSKTPADIPDGIESWKFAIDSDLDKQSEPIVLGDNRPDHSHQDRRGNTDPGPVLKHGRAGSSRLHRSDRIPLRPLRRTRRIQRMPQEDLLRADQGHQDRSSVRMAGNHPGWSGDRPVGEPDQCLRCICMST